MPVLSRFYGIIIRMMFDDQDRHHMPHIHVTYNERKAVISLNGSLLAGDLPKRQYKMVLKWISLHEKELQDAWEKAVQNMPIDPIEPLP